MDLRADCERCAGLCCVAPAFAASADFALDKPAGRPCPHLGGDFRCGIHPQLRERGFPGCTVYDCFGAGQRVTAAFGGRDWRSPEVAAPMFAVFEAVRALHELLWYVTDALTRPAARPLYPELVAAAERLSAPGLLTADAGTDLPAPPDIAASGRPVDDLLRRASVLVRAAAPRADVDHTGADLIGRTLRGSDLRGATLRGALLLGADLRRADLRAADLIGADLRAADLRGADLRDALFVTQPQLAAARGDAATRLPERLSRPAHWTTPAPA